AGVDVARLYDRYLEIHTIVRRVSGRAASVERAPRGAADVAASGELLRERGRKNAGVDRAVLQRGGVFVQFDETREFLACEGKESTHLLYARCGEVAAGAAWDDAIHHQ